MELGWGWSVSVLVRTWRCCGRSQESRNLPVPLPLPFSGPPSTWRDEDKVKVNSYMQRNLQTEDTSGGNTKETFVPY